MIAKIKTLILCIGFLAVADVFAYSVMPYSFTGKRGEVDIDFEYQVMMPNTDVTSFDTTIKYASGHHRVEIMGVKLKDGEAEWLAGATRTDGNEIVEAGNSYSGQNNYHNVYTFTPEKAFSADKIYTLVVTLKVQNASPSHVGKIKLSGGVVFLTPSFWASFDAKNLTSDRVSSAGAISTGVGYAPVMFGGNAFDLNGDYYGTQNFLSVDPNAFTLSLNVKTGTNPNGLVVAFGSKNNKGGLAIRRGSDGDEILVTKANSVDPIIRGEAPKSSYIYTSITLTYVDKILTLYINGECKGTAENVEANDLIPGSNVQFGRRHGGVYNGEAQSIGGAIDDLVVWDGTALSENQVKDFYNNNYRGALRNGIVFAYEFESNVTPTIGGNAEWEWNYNEEGVYVNSLRQKTDGNFYKSIVLDKNVHPGMGYTWSEEFTTAIYVNLADCANDGTILSIGSKLMLRKVDGRTIALCNNDDDSLQYVSAECESLSIGYHLIVVKKSSSSLSLQIDNTKAVEALITEESRPEITSGLQLGVRWENGYPSYSPERPGVGPRVDDFFVWNSTLSDEAIASLTEMYPMILENTVTVEGLGPHKLSELMANGLGGGDNVAATIILDDGATFEIDAALNFSLLSIVANGAITIKVTDLDNITQAQLDSILNTSGVTGGVVNNFGESFDGYEKDGVMYPLIYRGAMDNNSWEGLTNWATGYRTNGEVTNWIAYAGTVVPGAPSSNEWRATLVDGDLIGENISAGEDGYKTVAADTLEGWNSKITVANGVHLTIDTLNKLQGGCVWRVDSSSKITVSKKGAEGNNASDNRYFVEAKNGLEFVEMPMPGGTAYLGIKGSIIANSFADSQTIGGVMLDLGTIAEGRKVVCRKLYSFISGTTFNIANNAVTTNMDQIPGYETSVLSEVGDYKFEIKEDGYYVSYMAYAEEDEIGRTVWTNATGDGLWSNAANWSHGLPAEGAAAVVEVSGEVTLTVPENGVRVGTLAIKGSGKVILAGGKITAEGVVVKANLSASDATLELAPMDIAEGVVVEYTASGDANNSEKLLPALTGDGVFSKFGPERLTVNANLACEPQLVWNAGTLRFTDARYERAYDVIAKDGTTVQLGKDYSGSLQAPGNVFKFEGGSTFWFLNGNNELGSNVRGVIVIDSSAEKPVLFKGSYFGNNTNIEALIKGNGVLSVKNTNSNYFTFSGVISNGEEGGKLAILCEYDFAAGNPVVFAAANTFIGGFSLPEEKAAKITNAKALGAGIATIDGTLQVGGNGLGSKVTGSGVIAATANETVQFVDGNAIIPSYENVLTINGKVGGTPIFDISTMDLANGKRFNLLKVNEVENLPEPFTDANFVNGIPTGWVVALTPDGLGYCLKREAFVIRVR